MALALNSLLPCLSYVVLVLEDLLNQLGQAVARLQVLVRAQARPHHLTTAFAYLMVHFNLFSRRRQASLLRCPAWCSTGRCTVIGTFGRVALHARDELISAVEPLQEQQVLRDVLVLRQLLALVAAGRTVIVIILDDRVKPLTRWWCRRRCFTTHYIY